MKPSERIKEILEDFAKNRNYYPNDASVFSQAIIDYLDEEAEKNKPCEHKETEDYKGAKYCLNCNLVGNF